MSKVTNKERQRCWRYRTFLGGNKMSEADKLFRKLGYKKSIFKNGINYSNNDDDEITFVDYQDYGKTIDVDKFGCHLTLQELKAINMKCKELGWSDE